MSVIRPMAGGISLAAIGSLLLCIAGLICLQGWHLQWFVGVFAAELCVYGYAVWQVLGTRLSAAPFGRRSLVAILVLAASMRAVAFFAPQALSTDAFRYVWDGRVQAAGINPYRYIPADPALAALRDAAIYPNINRATYAHTIYPPTAQLFFLAIERFCDSIGGMKFAMVVFDALNIAILIMILRTLELPLTRVLLYAWHPLPIWEFAGTGHVDAIAITFVLLAVLAASRRASLWSGVALAAATLVKFYPAVIGPVLYRRWDWRMPAGFVLTLAALYAPYLGVGSGVFGFLVGYTREEGMADGRGIFLWSLLKKFTPLSGDALHLMAPLALIVMAGIGAWVMFGNRPRQGETAAGAFLLAGTFTLLVTPHDPWYFTWLIPFLCLRFSIAHFWLTGACALMYVAPEPTGLATQSAIYGPFVLLLILQSIVRRKSTFPETLNAKSAARPLDA